MAQPIRSCPHCGGCTNRGHCAMPSWRQARAKNQRERVTDRGRNEQRPPTLASGFQSGGASLNIRGLGRKCGFGAVVLLGKFSSSLTNPGADFMCLAAALHTLHAAWADRKSTRLNSSHVAISYAVFCLKKKTCAGAQT